MSITTEVQAYLIYGVFALIVIALAWIAWKDTNE